MPFLSFVHFCQFSSRQSSSLVVAHSTSQLVWLVSNVPRTHLTINSKSCSSISLIVLNFITCIGYRPTIKPRWTSHSSLRYLLVCCRFSGASIGRGTGEGVESIRADMCCVEHQNCDWRCRECDPNHGEKSASV